MNKYKIKEHMNIIRLLKTEAYNKDKLLQLQDNSLKVNLLKYDEYKIMLLKELEKYYDVKPLDVSAIGIYQNGEPLIKHYSETLKRLLKLKKKSQLIKRSYNNYISI